MKKLYLFLLLFIATLFYSQKNFTPQSDYYFYENKGQIIDQDGKLNPQVKYLFNSGGLNVQIKKEGFSYDVYEVEKTKKRKNHRKKEDLISLDKKPQEEFDYKFKYHRVDIDFLNANKNPEIIAEGKSADYENYYNIPGKPEGVTQVYRYQKITYKNIYPNVDLVFFKPKDTTKSVEYNFIINPGGRISNIKLKFKGAKTKIKDGKLSMNLRFGEMQENIPHSWIEDKAAKTNLSVQFKEIEDGVFGFEAPQDSFEKKVVIDPVPTRIWGTYYGGIGSELGKVKVDSNSNVYIYGGTQSANNIATQNTYQLNYGGGYYDSFIGKLDKDGKRIWGTYFGSVNNDGMTSIDFDKNFNIYCSGTTINNQLSNNVGQDIFILKLNEYGQKVFLNFFGGSRYDYILDLKVDKNFFYIVGETYSADKISTFGAYQYLKPTGTSYTSAFLTQFDENGNITWSTYYGGKEACAFFEIIEIKNNIINLIAKSVSTDAPVKNQFSGNIGSNASNMFVQFSTNGNFISGSYFGYNKNDIPLTGKIINNELKLLYWNIGSYKKEKPVIQKIDLLTNNIISEKFLDLNFMIQLSGFIDNFGNSFFSYMQNDNISHATPNSYEYDINVIRKALFVKYNVNDMLEWSTYYADDGGTQLGNIYKDQNNFLYFTGMVSSSTRGFSTPGVFMEKPSGRYENEIFIAKFADCESNVKVSYTPICNGKDLELKAEGGDTYEWFGPNNFHSFDQNPIIKNAQISDSGEYFVRMTGANTCGGIFTLNVVIGNPAPPKPDVMDLPEIKGDCNTKLTAPTATDGCGNKFTATTTDKTSGFAPGTYTITWKYDDGNGNIFTQTQKVIISSPALPTAVSPQTFCATLSPKISDIQISGQNIIWYDASGNVINTTTPLVDGTTYHATQTINGCESNKLPILIKVNATPLPTGNANQDFCTSRNAQVKDLIVTGTSLNFYDNLGNSLPLSTVLQDNTSYFVTQTLNNCESPKFEIKVTLTVNSLPAQDYQLVFCNDTTANSKTEDLRKYQENIITGSSSYIFEYFDENNNAISDYANRNIQIGNNSFNVKVKSRDGCWKMVKLILQLNPKPVVNLPSEAEYCRGLFVELDAGSGYASYLWNTGATTQKISVNKEGTYTVKVTNSSNCENSSSTLVKQSILANILKVEIFNNNAKVLLSANGDFEFSLDNVNWQDSNEFKNLRNGNHTAYVKTKMGCIIGQMNFTIFNILNSFTPNGDGINDTWKIDGIENYPNSEITVLDRQSTIILHVITNGSFEWNGDFNGRVLPTGTYWYIIKVSDGRLFQGSLLIKKRN